MREQRPATRRPDPSQLQFSISSLLLAMTAVAVLVVVWQRLGAVWGASIVWFLVLVAAHVAANAHGSRQTRRTRSERQPDDGVAPSEGSSKRGNAGREMIADASKHSAPITRLGVCHGPAGRVLLCVITAGSALGAVVGTVGFVFLTTAETSGILLGVVSASILGGFLGFACGSFVLVMSRAFHEAAQDPKIVAAYRRGDMA